MVTPITPSRFAGRTSTHRLLLAVLLWALASPLLCQQGRLPAESPPVRRALLIGINNYAGPVRELLGCVNDVEAMRSVLTSRFGFAPRNIRVLEDRQATRDAIVGELDSLAKRARRDDIVFILFAGHGSQVPDQDGDEKDDHLDESLVPYDGRTGKVRDITDDELHSLVSRFRTESLTVVLDCCHSGTGTRSLAVQARTVPADTREELYRTQEASARAIVPLASERHVLLTAAAANQSALDGPIDGRPRGFFSYALAKVLTTVPPSASTRSVFRAVEREIRRLGDRTGVTMPEPMLEGPAERFERSLFGPQAQQGQARPARVAWVEVGVDPTTRTAFLANSFAPGVAVGAVWALYPPGELNFRAGQSLALGEVTTIAGGRALLRIDPPMASVQGGARASLVAPPPVSHLLPLCFVGLAPARAAALEKELRRRIPGVRAVGTSDYAVHHVRISEREVTIFGADGVRPVGSFPVAVGRSIPGRLAEFIENNHNRSSLASLDNPASSMGLDVRLSTSRGPREAATGPRGVKVVADIREPIYRIRKDGDARNRTNCLQVEIRCNTDCYITIVDVDAAGKISQLFPNSYTRPGFLPDGRLTAGRWIRIPDSIEGGNRAGFHWDIAPPAGRDTIRVFASTEKETARRIRQSIREIENGTLTPGQQAAPLRALRRRLGLAGRGIKVVQDKPAKPVPAEGVSDWTATSVTFRIES